MSNILPVDFENRMKEYLGEDFSEFLASYSCEEIKSLRLNRLFLDCSDDSEVELQGTIKDIVCCNDGEDKVCWESLGYYYDENKVAPGKHPLHEAGAYYIQEASAMSPVVALDIKPGERVLDLCASPGGKSTQIGAYLNGEGILISNEIVPKRAKILSENIERMGIRNALVISEDPRNISDRFCGYFDKILVDAPCSGEGMFRRSDVAVNEWSLDNVNMCAERQSWILDEAYKMLADGGRLVYSTCTFSKEENENNAKALVNRYEDLNIIDDPIYLKGGIEKGYDGVGYRLWPHKVKGEGHYFCIFEKKNLTNIKTIPMYGYEKGMTNKDKASLKDMEQFVKDTMEKPEQFLNGIFVKFGDEIYKVPNECPSLKGIKVLRPGLHMGTLNKNRFEPSHSLAKCLKPSEIKNVCKLSINNNVIYKYMRGETFNIDESIDISRRENGFYLITIEDYPIGFGKLTNLVMKNKIPKGLRKELS